MPESGEATLKWRMATAVLARTRFGSSTRRLRQRTWSTLPGRPLGRLQRLWLEKTDPILCTGLPTRGAPRECG